MSACGFTHAGIGVEAPANAFAAYEAAYKSAGTDYEECFVCHINSLIIAFL